MTEEIRRMMVTMHKVKKECNSHHICFACKYYDGIYKKCSIVELDEGIPEDWSVREVTSLINETEYNLIKLLNGYLYIARDKDEWLYVYSVKPDKLCDKWRTGNGKGLCYFPYIELFSFIRYEDLEPHSIKKLIEDYERINDVTYEKTSN